ncbi:MAG TPA: Fic family protein [Solirubrobacterales bacterium]|jgi:Fic family protein|nr:Fic family protein [Solirubrobacterales bacterium]
MELRETTPHQSTSAELLDGTPYVVEGDSKSQLRFSRVASKSTATHERAKRAADHIAEYTGAILGPYESAMRSELVAESNQMEGYDSTTKGVRDLVRLKEDLLHIEIQHFVEYVRDDPKLLDDLGLYRAYLIADEWAESEQRPREYELRSLHTLIMGAEPFAGSYKSTPNRIGGSAHVPAEPWDVPEAMADLARWFTNGTGDPVLDATVAHAWLTHIHPFDDGNGRMARLVANLALIQARFPPLLLRAGSDRGQYLDALAASDDGDILPLYDLFAGSLRKMVCDMERPQFVERKVRSELLRTPENRYDLWKKLLRTLFTTLEHKTARPHGWSVRLMGYPAVEDFVSLEEGSTDGNGWWLKLGSQQRGGDRWLLWFGPQSRRMRDLLGNTSRTRSWPSVFFDEPDDDPTSIHPWTGVSGTNAAVCPHEMVVMPGTRSPIAMRVGPELQMLDLTDGASLIAKTLCR